MQTGALSLESTKLSSRGRTLVEQLKETLAKPPTPTLHAHSAKGGTLPLNACTPKLVRLTSSTPPHFPLVPPRLCSYVLRAHPFVSRCFPPPRSTVTGRGAIHMSQAPMPATPAPAPSKLPEWRSQDAKDTAAALEQAVKRAAAATPQLLADTTTTAAAAAATGVKPPLPLPLPRSAPPAVAATSRPGTGASLASLASDASGFVRHQV